MWYRDSQLYETKQINEFTAEVANYTDELQSSTNFIKWTGDKEDQLEIEVTIKIPKRVRFSRLKTITQRDNRVKKTIAISQKSRISGDDCAKGQFA